MATRREKIMFQLLYVGAIVTLLLYFIGEV